MAGSWEIIRKASGKGGWPGPGEWRAMLTGTVYVGCPACGLLASLDHRIAKDGTVTPSLACPSARCGWHGHVVLEGWDRRA